MNRYTILAVLALMLCSCGAQKRLAKEHKQLDIAYRALDSLNKELTIHAISRDIKTIDDKSRIVVTKYTTPDSSGKQSIDYTVVIDKAVEQSTETTVEKHTEETTQSIIAEETIDNSIVHVSEKVDDAPVVKTVKNVKWIVGMLLIAYIIYIMRKAA